MSQAPAARQNKAGPLSMQMGVVTGAVDDLVHGYEQLVHSLPNLTEQIGNVHADTEQMAKQLEHRTRSMIDGYEFLQGLSTQLPEMFQETAAQHRKTLQDAVASLGAEDQAILAANEEKLNKIKNELNSISHERVIVDVMLRPLINETRRIHAQAKAESTASSQQRSARNLSIATSSHPGNTTFSNRLPVNNMSANRILNSRVVAAVPTVAPESTYNALHRTVHHSHSNHANTQNSNNHHYTNNSSTAVLTNSRNPEGGDIHVSYKDTAELLSTPIYIPEYDPHRVRPATNTGGNRPNGLGGYVNIPSSYDTRSVNTDIIRNEADRLIARAVGGNKMLPSVRVGPLPPDLLNIKSDPTIAGSAADEYQKELIRTRRRIKQKVVYTEKETLAHSLRTKLEQTDSEVAALKKKLTAAHNSFGKDQSAAIAKLQRMIVELRDSQDMRDEALLKAMEALLREFQAKHKAQPAVNHDAAILAALEALLTPPPPVIDRLHEYKVMTVRPKIPVPIRSVPVVVPVPVPIQKVVESKVAVEVQTEPMEVPVVPTVEPTPVPASVPTPVVQPTSVVVNVPERSTVEKELIELVNHVVNTQHQTMQGNQALILSLIHERNAQFTVTEEREEYCEPPIPPVVEEAPVIVEPPPPLLPLSPPLQPQYSTAFGTVVLGAQILQGPYTTPPTLIPSDHKPCILRGIPPPEKRPIRPVSRVPERVQVMVDGDQQDGHEPRREEEVTDIPINIEADNSPMSAGGSGGSGNNIKTAGEGIGDVKPTSDSSGSGGSGRAGDSSTSNPDTALLSLAAAPTTTTDRTIPIKTTMTQNIGLTHSGTSSTAGRGGATTHSTPGKEVHVPYESVPHHMRRIASNFTLRALNGSTGAEVVNGLDLSKVGINSNTTMYKNSTGFNAEADAVASTNTSLANNTNAHSNHAHISFMNPSNATAVATINHISTVGFDHANNTTTTTHNPDQGLFNLLRNLQVLSSNPMPTTTTTTATTMGNTSASAIDSTLTPAVLAQHISEGVQRGVKEALGLMDTHARTAPYYNPHPSTNDALHHSMPAHHSHPNSDPHYHPTDYSTRGLLQPSMHDTPADLRKSLQLIKNKRTTFANRNNQSRNAGIRSTHYSNLPHCTNHATYDVCDSNRIEQNHTANRDLCQPPRRKALTAQQRNQEHKDIVADIEYSHRNAHNILQSDENSSFNDSVSLDEETAAYLRDPLLYNIKMDDSLDVMSSLENDNHHNNVRLMHRDVHTKRHNELFDSTEQAPIKSHAPSASNTATTRAHPIHPSSKVGNANNPNEVNNDTFFVPLVSKILQQSATEDAIYSQLHRRADTNTTSSMEGHSVYSEGVDNDVDNDDRMWDLRNSAPIVSLKQSPHPTTNITTKKAHTADTKLGNSADYNPYADGAMTNMQLIRPKRYQQNEAKEVHSSDDFESMGSSVEYSSGEDRSILTHSTNSTNTSIYDPDPAVDAGRLNSHTPEGTQPATTHAHHTHNTHNTHNTHTTHNVNTYYRRTSTTDINRSNLQARSVNTSVSNSVNSTSTTTSSSLGARQRVSMLPRYSPHKYNKKPTAHTAYTTKTPTEKDGGNTELLAAQMMLNVLELHRPSNYSTTPYLSNPISSHLKRNGYSTAARSKIYATESVDSRNSSESDRNYVNNRYFNTNPESDLDCTGSSISSAPDELLDHHEMGNINAHYSDTAHKAKSGLTLMGVGNNKLLRVNRK